MKAFCCILVSGCQIDPGFSHGFLVEYGSESPARYEGQESLSHTSLFRMHHFLSILFPGFPELGLASSPIQQQLFGTLCVWNDSQNELFF